MWSINRWKISGGFERACILSAYGIRPAAQGWSNRSCRRRASSAHRPLFEPCSTRTAPSDQPASRESAGQTRHPQDDGVAGAVRGHLAEPANDRISGAIGVWRNSCGVKGRRNRCRRLGFDVADVPHAADNDHSARADADSCRIDVRAGRPPGAQMFLNERRPCCSETGSIVVPTCDVAISHLVKPRQTTVRLPQELAEEAEAVARVRGVSVNSLIVEALSAEIERVRGDVDFTSRAKRLLERDKELVDRLAR